MSSYEDESFGLGQGFAERPGQRHAFLERRALARLVQHHDGPAGDGFHYQRDLAQLKQTHIDQYLNLAIFR